MQFTVEASALNGTIAIPGSKSHTIRGVLLASLAAGESVLTKALTSADTEAAVDAYQALGAGFAVRGDAWHIRGVGGRPQPPTRVLDMRNSGTTTRVCLGTCALLADGEAVIEGDAQLHRRPSGPLVTALRELGANIQTATGAAPFTVRGGLRGGRTSIEARSSQYLSSLLLCCPFAPEDSDIEVPVLFERPYVQMTLDWLTFCGIQIDHAADLSRFHIPGRQRLNAFERRIPADFSTATFFLVAGALGDNDVTCTGLDLDDSQSDKAVVDFLRRMGANVEVTAAGIRVHGGALHGADLDLNDCPDTLPMLAVLGCFAEGTTRLLNCPQARIKETDRIAVMAAELARLGADVEELEDGLVVRQSRLHGAAVDGCGDHRVVMSLAIAGTRLAEPVVIDTAEAAAVTFPDFAASLEKLGGRIAQQG